jgi:hypothetical protein
MSFTGAGRWTRKISGKRHSTPEEMEEGIFSRLEFGEKGCLRNTVSDAIIDELSKAGFMRGLPGRGLTTA